MTRQSGAGRSVAPILRGALLAAGGAALLGLAHPFAGSAAAADAVATVVAEQGVAGRTATTVAATTVAASADAAAIVVAQSRGSSRASNWDDDFGDAWEDYNRTILQMQREAISSQEEAAREAGRQQRREEIEQDREKAAAEREEYFDAVLEASQASLRAPRGVFYRKPGYSSSDPPGSSATKVEVGGMSYIYDQGIFWLQQGSDYLVVTAPFGVVVGALPRGAVRVPAAGTTLWYFFGTFLAEKDGAYTVVKPPPGVLVYYLPDGYTREKLGGTDVYRFGGTFFKPVFVQGLLVYQVVAGP